MAAPPFATAVGCFRIRLFTRYRDQVAINVLYATVGKLGVGRPDEDVIANKFNVAHAAAFRDCISQEAEYQGCGVTRFTGFNQWGQEFYDTAGTGPGTAGAPGTAPSQVCGVLTKFTNLAGRAGRGRFYVPFPPAGAVNGTDDLLTAAYKTTIGDFGVGLLTPLATPIPLAADQTIVTCLRYTNDADAANKTLTMVIARKGFGTQRRRGFFGRPNTSPLD